MISWDGTVPIWEKRLGLICSSVSGVAVVLNINSSIIQLSHVQLFYIYVCRALLNQQFSVMVSPLCIICIFLLTFAIQTGSFGVTSESFDATLCSVHCSIQQWVLDISISLIWCYKTEIFCNSCMVWNAMECYGMVCNVMEWYGIVWNGM